MRRASGAVLLLTIVLLAACSGGGDDDDFALDGRARVPDDEGIVTDVDLESVTLDGDRTYDVDRGLVSFSAIDLSTVPLLFTKGQYVQVGTDGGTVEWIGAIAKPLATADPFVVYSGEVERVEDGEVEFANGTVLHLDRALEVEVRRLVGDEVRVSLDPEEQRVTEVTR
jgi:hypothetical protein